MRENISVIIKQPGEAPYKTEVENTLKSLQELVRGYIETVTFAEDAAVICNEEGRLLEMPFNCNLFGVDFVGPIVIAGVDGEEFCDVPVKFEDFKLGFRNLWENE